MLKINIFKTITTPYIWGILVNLTFLTLLSFFINVWFTTNYPLDYYNHELVRSPLDPEFHEVYLFFSILVTLSILVVDNAYFIIVKKYPIWEFWLGVGAAFMIGGWLVSFQLLSVIDLYTQYLAFKLSLIYLLYALLQWLVMVVEYRIYKK